MAGDLERHLWPCTLYTGFISALIARKEKRFFPKRHLWPGSGHTLSYETYGISYENNMFAYENYVLI